MKKIILIFCLIAISIVSGASVNPEKWRDNLVKEGRQKLKELKSKNAKNDSKGMSHLNSYLVVVGDNEYPNSEFIKQRKGAYKGGEESVPYLLGAPTLGVLDSTLRKMNSTSIVKTYVLLVHFMPLEFINEIPDNQSIADFFAGKKTSVVEAVAKPMSDEARKIVDDITYPYLKDASVSTLFCGFVHFKVYKNSKEGLSQWVYYPRNSLSQFEDNYKRMLNAFMKEAVWPTDDVGKVHRLIEVLNKNNNEYKKVKSALDNIMSITQTEEMAKLLEGISVSGLTALDNNERIHALKILSKGVIPDSQEMIIINLIKSIRSPQDANELISALKKANDQVSPTISVTDGYGKTTEFPNSKHGMCLLQCISNDTGDATLGIWGKDNYQELTRALISLCKLSPDFMKKVDELSDTTHNDLIASRTIFYNYNSFWSKLGSTVSTFPNPKIDRSTDYSGDCNLKTTTQLFFSYLAPNTTLTSEELSPFEPIVFVNQSSLGMLADLDGDGNMFVSPAFVLKYADDKAWNQTASDATMAAIDAASMLTGYGEIKAGITGLRRAWTLIDMTNSGINLALNASGLSENPQVKEILDAYNLVTGGVAITRMGAGGIKNVYTYIKGKQLLSSKKVADLLKALDAATEDALRGFAYNDLASVEGLVKKVKADANARSLTTLVQQADRILEKVIKIRQNIYKGFSLTEGLVIEQGKDFFKSDILQKLRQAYKEGKPAEFVHQGRIVGYEPTLPMTEGYSAMTISPNQLDPNTLQPLNQAGWFFGPRAFMNEMELKKTILQELHRLNFSQVVKSGTAYSDIASTTTKDAFQFAEDAWQYLE